MPGPKPTFLWVALLFSALCLPPLLSGRRSNFTSDEATYYLPAIKQIRAHWPALDLQRDSLSATAPGYQYLLATIALVTGVHRVPLRLATFAASLVLLWLLWRSFPLRQRPLATAAILALACSNFYVKSASWIVTDNAALLAMTGALFSLLLSSANSVAATAWSGVLGAAATFIRQIDVWLAVPMAWRAWCQHMSGRGRTGLWIMAAPLAPIVVLALLIIAWHGVVPPRWAAVHYPRGVNFAAPLVYELAITGCLGGFFCVTVAGSEWRKNLGNRWAAVGAGVGFILALAGATSPSVPAGRWGGYFWVLAGLLPAPAGRSIVFLLLAPLGLWLAVTMFHHLKAAAGAKTATSWAGSGLMWAISNAANREVFQRYFEPAILIFMILWLALIVRNRPDTQPVRWTPLAMLAVGQFGLTVITVHYQVFIGPLTR
jgi:hypothetical protein